MQSIKSRGLQAFRRVKAWFVENPEVIAASGSSAPALTAQVNALDGVIVRMTEAAGQQVTQTQQATLVSRDEAELRSELRGRHMKAIVTVSRALRGRVPGIGVLRMPASKLRSEGLVKAAEAMATTAAVYQDVLIEHGLPQDFIPQLNVAIAALKASVDARGVALSNRVEATSNVAQDYDVGRQLVAMIDASLLHALKGNAPLLASWRNAKRIAAKPGVPRGSEAATSTGGAANSAAVVPLTVGSGAFAAAPQAQPAGTAAATSSSVAA